MKLSMMSYTMARQPEHFNVVKMLELTRELNLAGIDFVRMNDDVRELSRLHGVEIDELRKMVDDHGLTVVCYTFNAVGLGENEADVRAKGLEYAKRGVEVAVLLGAPVVMIPTPASPQLDRHTTRRNWIEGLKEVLPFARDAGVLLTVENFPGEKSPFVIADDMLEAVREVPGLKITYDAGNAATGEEPSASFTRCADHVVHAHFKDWYVQDAEGSGYRPMLDGRYYKSALIGEGVVDHKSVLAAMKKAGYSGYINIEYEGNECEAGPAIRRATAYLRETWDGLVKGNM